MAQVNTPLTPRLKATDDDSGRNAKVRLRIVAGNRGGMFRINPVSGVLYVGRPLDREQRSTYTFTVSALDQANTGMRKQASAKVRVFVEDVNDNSPEFEKLPREVLFDENQQAKARVVKVKAKDLDLGENGIVSYSIANLEAVPFEIDSLSGVVKSTRLIDYESDRRTYRYRLQTEGFNFWAPHSPF